MAQLITVRVNKSDHQPLGIRLQGGKDFGTPLVVQKVNGGSPAERAGLQAGDALIRVNATDVYSLRHQDAQDAIRGAGSAIELTIQRGGGTWRPTVTPTGSLPRPGSRPLGAAPTPVTNTSLKATQQPTRAFGSGHNNVAKPFGYMNGNDPVKSIVNKQYNTPVNIYSDKTIAETLSAQTEVLAGGYWGRVNFKKNEKTYDAEKSAVFKVLQEEQNDPEPVEVPAASSVPAPVSGLRHVQAPVTRPDAPLNNTGGLPPGQNICEECERLITGVFVRIKDKNLHVECFKCSTCGTSLKNQGYYNINGKLYCDIHAKLVARQNPPAPNLEPVTVPPGARIPTNTYSTPLPPLSTNNYTNGSSSLFSPSSNLSGPKPFGSSIGSAYSPSLSPRSGPMSPARPVPAPASAPVHAPVHSPAAPAPTFAPAAPPQPPFAPITEPQTTSSPYKTEYKSQAEERLIRKMAKMALNGYEIGIQRKIKPADHIQSMADRIQDTIVTKHPLNADGTSSGENSHDNTLKRSPNKISDQSYKMYDSMMSIGDKVKDVIYNNELEKSNFNDSVAVCGSAPVPPPLPTSPMPLFNIHSTPTGHITAQANIKKQSDSFPKNFTSHITSTAELENNDKSLNGSDYSSSEDSIKETNTLRNKSYEKSFLNGSNINQDVKKSELVLDNNFYSNTLNKKKIFENKDLTTTSSNSDNGLRAGSCMTNTLDTNTKNKINIFEISPSSEDKIKNHHQNGENKSFSSNFNDLSYNLSKCENDSIIDIVKQDDEEILQPEGINNVKDNTEPEVLVKRRQKKTNRNDDGRRDSHIIARPLSTMTSVDVTDGLYPVCHKCDKEITRGPFITALGRIWCPEHFICVNATCRRPLQDIGFVEENGQLYCEYCFEQYIAPSCDKCHAKIKGDCLNAIGKHFHPECFNCVYCGKLFGNNPFFLEDGLPYCEADWNELFTTKCFACGFPVEAGDRWVEALNNNYHSQCFNCTYSKLCSRIDSPQIRCAKRTSKDRVSSPREVDLSVKRTPARSPQVIYNSDTVYSTITFRPVSPSPITSPPPNSPLLRRTRKLETPLHFDGGLFSDIRSTDGKLLSKVTVDKVLRSTHHDITDSPSTEVHYDERNYVDDITKTEMITNKDVITVKFTPVQRDLESPHFLTTMQGNPTQDSSVTSVEYIKDDFKDLQSYKIVNSLCKTKLFEMQQTDDNKLDTPNTENCVKEGADKLNMSVCMDKEYSHLKRTRDVELLSGIEKDKLDIPDTTHIVKEDSKERSITVFNNKEHSPLANFLVSEQLSRIDNKLQESLQTCFGVDNNVNFTAQNEAINKTNEVCELEQDFEQTSNNYINSYPGEVIREIGGNHDKFETNKNAIDISKLKAKSNSDRNKIFGFLRNIYNLPIHYHAAILCFFLIVYNLIYQYIKQKYENNKKLT